MIKHTRHCEKLHKPTFFACFGIEDEIWAVFDEEYEFLSQNRAIPAPRGQNSGIKILNRNFLSNRHFSIAMPTKSSQNLSPGRSRLAESDFAVKNLRSQHPDVKIEEKYLELRFLNPTSLFSYFSLLGPIRSCESLSKA